MTSIIKATSEDFQLLADIGKVSFIESHGSSASGADISKYVNEKFTDEVIRNELADQKNIYHIIYHDNRPAGYSKIIFNSSHPDIPEKNVTKLERLYLLKEFYGSKSGPTLFHTNLELSRNNHQAGMWLFVWKGNHRAFAFYQKKGFKVIGSYDFKLTAAHSNPNYHMLLKYDPVEPYMGKPARLPVEN